MELVGHSGEVDLTKDDLKRIITALIVLQEIDANHRYTEEVAKTKQLLDRLRDPAPQIIRII